MALCRFADRRSITHPTQPLCTPRVRRRRRLTQHSLPKQRPRRALLGSRTLLEAGDGSQGEFGQCFMRRTPQANKRLRPYNGLPPAHKGSFRLEYIWLGNQNLWRIRHSRPESPQLDSRAGGEKSFWLICARALAAADSIVHED
jgi:hypothetical protein